MIRLLRLGSWKTAEAEECFVHQGEPLDRLMVIYSGRACVMVEGKIVAELQPGQFIGGISYITEEAAPANIVSLEPTRHVSWPKENSRIS
jgi:CRP-like cAMP-binding protein